MLVKGATDVQLYQPCMTLGIHHMLYSAMVFVWISPIFGKWKLDFVLLTFSDYSIVVMYNSLSMSSSHQGPYPFIRFKIVRWKTNRVWITNTSWKSNFTKVSNIDNDILQSPKIANICQSAVASDYNAGWRGRCSNWKSHAMCRLYESNIRQTLYIKCPTYTIKWLKK